MEDWKQESLSYRDNIGRKPKTKSGTWSDKGEGAQEE